MTRSCGRDIDYHDVKAKMLRCEMGEIKNICRPRQKMVLIEARK